MQLIAVTGGIASGKSVVAAHLAELGAVVVDADRIAREVVEPGTPALSAIAEHFGPTVISADGSLNRPALGAIIFADAAERAVLNAITHPAVGARSRELFAAAGEANPDAVVFYDVPLLAESATGSAPARTSEFDRIVVVHASPQTRVDRLVRLRGLTEQEATARVTSQASDDQRLAVADDVITSDGTLEETLAQVDELWQRLTQ